GVSEAPAPGPDMTDPERLRVSRFAAACWLIPAVLGASALLGWWLEQPTLRNGFGIGVAMNPATAVALLLGAGSLWLGSVARPRSLEGRLSAACGLGVLLIAALKLGNLWFGWSIEVDQLLFPDQLAAAVSGRLQNRMAPNTAFSFLLAGSGLLLVRAANEVPRLLGRSLAMLGGLGGFLTLIAYVYRRMSLAGLPGAIPMAVNTGLALVMLSLGIIGAGARRESDLAAEGSRGLRRRVNLLL